MILRNTRKLVTFAQVTTLSLCVGAYVGMCAPSNALAEGQYASSERSDAALGHYARARALLVDALAEFEQARKLARPDLLIDPEEWRLSLVSRTEELNRVLDPKPRVTRSGVRFRANSRLVGRDKERVPSIPDGAKASNTYGELEYRSLKKPNESSSASEIISNMNRDGAPNSAEPAKKAAPASVLDTNRVDQSTEMPEKAQGSEVAPPSVQQDAEAPAPAPEIPAARMPVQNETPVANTLPEEVPAPKSEKTHSPASKAQKQNSESRGTVVAPDEVAPTGFLEENQSLEPLPGEETAPAPQPAAKPAKKVDALEEQKSIESSELEQMTDTGDPDINRAVEEAIQERLKKLEGADAAQNSGGQR